MSRQIEVQFGTMFTPSEKIIPQDPDRVDIVIETGDGWIQTGFLYRDDNGIERIAPGGTAHIEDIGKLKGVMDSDEVINKMRSHFETRYNREYPQELMEHMEKESKKEPIILTGS